MPLPLHTVFALGPDWLDPEFLIETFGTLGLLAIVFVETGLLIGFFLPGDSLLFTAGLLSANGTLPDLWILVLLIPIAAIVGDQVGYTIGRKAGPAVFKREEGLFFQKEYVERSQEFFEKYGARTVVLARFVPIVRTFTPVMAGVGKMHYPTFLMYNVIGGILWGCGLTTLGYFLGRFDFVNANIEFIIIGIVLVSFIPVFMEIRRAHKGRGGRAQPPPAPRDTAQTAHTRTPPPPDPAG